MKNRINKKVVTAAILSVLIVVMLCASAFAASYSKTYGRTKEKLRVRASASTSATVIDNIIKDACVYISTSTTSGVNTFVKVTYRNSDGNIGTGWICQHDGDETLVTILSAAQAQNWYGVKSGNLPSKKVGTFTASQRAEANRAASATASTSSSSSSSFTKAYVEEVQTMLKELGYYYGDITGNIGNKTENAVEAFQKAYNLSADGVPGSKTYNRLKEVYKDKGGSSSSSAISGSGMRLNSSGADVRALQENLKALGYYTAELTGNFGTKTEAAVKAFQNARGLTADGIAGAKTVEAINKARKGSGSSSVNETLRLESTGENVRALQRDLAALGYYTGEVTGHFGEKTKTAVSKFQKAKGLSNDGIAGPSTLNAIVTALGGSGSLSSGSGANTGTLRPGDNNDRVKDMQERLYKLGIYYGEFTGNYGNLTEKAVRKFQDDNDLHVDGIAGSDTLKLLFSKTGGTYTGSGSTSNVIQYGTLNTDNVSLRESYSKSAKSVVELDRGKALKITKTVNVNGETWYYCTAEKGNYTYKGYVRSDYVTLGSYNDFVAGGGDDFALGVEVLGMIRVTGDKVSIRADHKTDSDRLGYAYKDDVYYYINTRSYDGGWFQISSGGWIQQKYATRLTEAEMDSYGGTSGQTSYRKGDTGEMVTWIQQALDTLDYFDGKVTGTYGNNTHDAVQDFQRDHGLSGDGIAGPKTIAAIQEALGNKIGSSGSNLISGKIVYNIDWFTYKNYLTSNAHFGINNKGSYKAMLTDIQTGKTFDIKIQSTGNHVDAEPWDSRDTNVLASIYGKNSGSQLKGVYKRRPMIMTTKKGANVLVSIYPEPHGEDTLPTNEYDGQFCLHMLGSKTHGTERVDNDVNGHQEMIAKGAALLKDKGYTILTTYDGKGVQTGGKVTDTNISVDINTGSGTTEVEVPPEELYDKTTVYYKSGSNWKYWHWTKNCTRLEGVDANGTGLSYKSRPTNIPECPECKPVWVYFGNTSTANFHYSKTCPNMLSMGYSGLYYTTETYAKKSRTHVCTHCSKDNSHTSNEVLNPTIVMLNSAKVYSASGWKGFCSDPNCKDLKAGVSNVESVKTTYGALVGDQKNPCKTCTVMVYYGKGASASAGCHYSSKCPELLEAGYTTLECTTEWYAKQCGRTHKCTVCTK